MTLDQLLKKSFNENRGSWYAIQLKSPPSKSEQMEEIMGLISQYLLINDSINEFALFRPQEDTLNHMYLFTDESELVYFIREKYFLSTTKKPDVSKLEKVAGIRR